MGDELEPSDNEHLNLRPPSHGRILWMMGIVGISGSIAGAAFISSGFGAGFLIGTIFAFLNYIWLQQSLKKIFAASALGRKPRMLAGGYFLRYIVLGSAIALIYAAAWVPIEALIFGMAGFGIATVIEGIIKIFSNVFSEKEI